MSYNDAIRVATGMKLKLAVGGVDEMALAVVFASVV